MVPDTLYSPAGRGKRAVRPLVWLSLAAAIACSPPPATGGGDSPGRVIRVMTYNIQAGGGKLENVAEAIRRATPDIVALQEVDVHWHDRSAFADQATQLSKSLGMHARFAPIYRIPSADPARPPREYGLALLSKCPILSFTNHTLIRLSTQQANAAPAPMPGFLEASVNLGSATVRVFNTHLDYRADPAIRQKQVAEMLGIIGASPGPTLLLGDLNAQPQAPELQPLFGKLKDVWSSREDPGFTYPAALPVRRIDYILASPHFRSRSVRVPVTTASDHRPVVADLIIPGGSDGRKSSCDGDGQ